jgi:WD40 repeat protein
LIKTWDQRQPESTASFEAHTDFVSDMVLHEREQCLVAVSGDGTLTVNDLRTNKVFFCLVKGIAVLYYVHWPVTLCPLYCLDEEAVQLLSAWQHVWTQMVCRLTCMLVLTSWL